MGGCPVHSSNDTTSNQPHNPFDSIRWDLVFLTLAVGMLALVLRVGLQLP